MYKYILLIMIDEKIKKIFDLQEKEILENLDQKYSKKFLEDLEKLEEDLFSDTDFLIIFQRYFYEL